MNYISIRTAARRIAFGASFLVVAGVAAVNSYEHMRDVALLGHQAPMLASTLPLSVDGLLIIASLAMAEDKAQHRHPRGWARLAFWFGATISLAANVASTLVHHHDPLSVGVAAWPPVALLIVTEILARPGKPIASQEIAPVSPEQATVTPVSPVAVVPVPASPVVAAAEAMTAAALPVPVSPAPLRNIRTTERVPATGPQPRGSGEVISPLTGRVLTPRPPRA